MIIILHAAAPTSTLDALLSAASAEGLEGRTMLDGRGGTLVGVDGALSDEVLALPGIEGVHLTHKPYMMASREHRERSVIRVRDVEIGGDRPVLMAGPCVVEGRAELLEAARAVRAAGADMLRGGAFKPRTSPYAFQGLGVEGLKLLAEARDVTGMPVVTEVMEPDQVDVVAEYADMLQVGSRNMANFSLLRRVGASHRPVLLKRGFAATVEEWLMSAEYILAAGNPNVVLCERGVRGFDPVLRFTLDLNAVPLAKELTHLPIVVDPSHGTGRRSLVEPMAMAGLAAGADGLIVEVHQTPDRAKCDANQTITPDVLARIHRRGLALREVLSATDLECDVVETKRNVVS